MRPDADFSEFSGPGGRPTAAESELIKASEAGTNAACRALPEPERVVSARLVAALATGRFRHAGWPDWSLDDAGVQLEGAVIPGRLALRRCEVRASLALTQCRLQDGIDMDGTTLRGDLFLMQCEVHGETNLGDARIQGHFIANATTFDNPGGRALYAQNVHAAGWFMRDARVTGRFDINSASILGQVNASDAVFTFPENVAVQAHSASVGSWVMERAGVTGRFELSGARIAGQFNATAGSFDNPQGDAIQAQGASAADWFMNDAVLRGRFDMNSAIVPGLVNTSATRFENPGGVAVFAQTCRIGAWLLSEAVVHGQFDVGSAEMTSYFGAEGAEFSHPAGTAIEAYFGTFAGGVFLRKGTRVAGDVDFTGATIAKVLDLSGSEFRAARHRAIRLQQASVTGEVSFSGARVFGHVHANRMRVEGRVVFRGARIVAAPLARQRGELTGPIAETFNDSDRARQERFQHHAIVMQEVRIDGRLVMPEICPEGIVDLARAECDTLEDDARGWPAPLRLEDEACDHRACITMPDGGRADVQHLVLDGFEYRFLEHPSGRPDHASDVATARIDWLAAQSVRDLKLHFNPQPWRHAATVLRSMGYDEAAQSLSIERRVRQRLSVGTTRFERFVSWLLHLVADYGFNPWKTVAISVACVALCAAMFWGGARLCDGPALRPDAAGRCGSTGVFVPVRYADFEPAVARYAYPEFQALWYSLDVFVPVLDLGAEGYWRANTHAYATFDLDGARPAQGIPARVVAVPVGWMLYILAVIETFLGSILIAIAVTGFTGLLTRDEK